MSNPNLYFLTNLPRRVLLGTDRYGDKHYLRCPTWNPVAIKWVFGIIEDAANENTCTLLKLPDSWQSRRHAQYEYDDFDMYDKLKDYLTDGIGDSPELETFVEVATTIYSLITTAELFGSGNSGWARNPYEGKMINTELSDHINEVLIPLQIKSLYELFKPFE